MNNVRSLVTFLALLLLCSCSTKPERTILSLNGEWNIAKTAGEMPADYTSKVLVPGLVDLASPALDSTGAMFLDGWYWHRRTFELKDTSFDKIILKIFKAKYHTKVYVNGKFAGENLFCFTPSYFDIKPFLSPTGEPNEIVIGIGCMSQLPDSIPNGYDNEKLKYIPGIYDNVEVILAGKPYIDNIQCVPDIENGRVRVVAEIETDEPEKLCLSYKVAEAASDKKVASKSFKPEVTVENGITKADFTIDIKDFKLWSPESPFLYSLTLSTGGDARTVNFGMRSFRLDPERGVALLNDKPYYLRGTNVCIFRFFEDPDRGTLPWEAQWPLTLHECFKDMGWNSMRYCIGFPPERWYDICDSMGFLLQDEFPVWASVQRAEKIKVSTLAEEYKRWMRERWNHPSVVIWDAQNESITLKTGEAIRAVRGLDLSNRPWDNGWSEPDRPTDPVESHPYIFIDYWYADNKKLEPKEGYRKEVFGHPRRPMNDPSERSLRSKATGYIFPNLSIINEYAWLWLNRDGSSTTLTDRVYDVLWNGKSLTGEQRLEIYARHLAMMTEYWRAHRRAFAVMHFCGLGYSRPEEPRGQTSDSWIDIRNLTFEPSFYKYVKPAFAPVGLMVDLWEKEYTSGSKITVPVYVINDLEAPAEQEVTVTFSKEGNDMPEKYSQRVTVEPYGVKIIEIEVAIPKEIGMYLLKASTLVNGAEVFSLRDIPVVIPKPVFVRPPVPTITEN